MNTRRTVTGDTLTALYVQRGFFDHMPESPTRRAFEDLGDEAGSGAQTEFCALIAILLEDAYATAPESLTFAEPWDIHIVPQVLDRLGETYCSWVEERDMSDPMSDLRERLYLSAEYIQAQLYAVLITNKYPKMRG